MQIGDLVVYDHYGGANDKHGIGIIVKTNPMYAFVMWLRAPSAGRLIANKKHLRVVSESR